MPVEAYVLIVNYNANPDMPSYGPTIPICIPSLSCDLVPGSHVNSRLTRCEPMLHALMMLREEESGRTACLNKVNSAVSRRNGAAALELQLGNLSNRASLMAPWLVLMRICILATE